MRSNMLNEKIILLYYFNPISKHDLNQLPVDTFQPNLRSQNERKKEHLQLQVSLIIRLDFTENDQLQMT